MDAAASAPQAGYDALVRQLSRQLSRQASLDDAAFNLVDLPGELLALILYRLLLAHDIAQLAPLCSALRDAASVVFVARPYSREVRTLAGHTGDVRCVAAADDGHVLTGSRRDKTVKVWRGDELVRTIEAHRLRGHGGCGAAGRRALHQRLASDKTAKLFTFGGELERTFEVGSWVPASRRCPTACTLWSALTTAPTARARSGCTTSTGRASTPSRGTPAS